MNKVALAILFLALLLSACGGSGGPEPASGLSGAVFAPAGGDVSGTTVIACFPVKDQCDQQKSRTTQITKGGSSASYRIDGLEASSYIVVAYKDANDNRQQDDGDFYGESPPVTPPAANIKVTMQVIGADGGGGGGGGNPNPAGGAVFPDFADGTNGEGPVLLSGAGGTLHLLYSAITQGDSGVYPVRYGTCASNCSTEAGWSFVTVGDAGLFGGYGQLALDGSGRPRVLYFAREDTDEDGQFIYAGCDADCANPANWTKETPNVPRPVGYLLDNTPYFALAPDGTPAFVYITQDGTYYAYRDGTRWTATKLSEGSLFNPSLAFTRASQPRMMFHYTSEDDESHLAYLECRDKTCQDYASGDLPNTVGYYANAVLRLNAGGAPRVLYYSGETLEYLWCNAACVDAASWSVTNLGTEAGVGEDGIDLVLDGAGQPHISYGDDFSADLFYSFCSAACESASPTWQLGLLVESSDEVEMDVAPPLPNCGASQRPTSFWYAGNVPSMTLNGGQPSFTYRVDNLQGCDGKLVAEGPSIVRFSNATPTAAQANHDQAGYNRASHHQADYDAAGLERVRPLQRTEEKGNVR